MIACSPKKITKAGIIVIKNSQIKRFISTLDRNLIQPHLVFTPGGVFYPIVLNRQSILPAAHVYTGIDSRHRWNPLVTIPTNQSQRAIEGDLLPASPTLGCSPSAGMINQDAANHLGRHREEVGPAPPVDARLVDEPDVRLVDEGRGLERVPGPFLGHALLGDLAQLVIDQDQEPIRRGAIRRAGRLDQARDFVLGRVCGHAVNPVRGDDPDPTVTSLYRNDSGIELLGPCNDFDTHADIGG